jgi:type I restriction enzyme M protein
MANLEIKREIASGRIWSHVRSKWLIETPEETVRQTYLLVLVNEYRFEIDQIDEELNLTGRGSAKARADFVIWRSVQDKTESKAPFIVVECKSDNVTITPADYTQGETYARICDAPFFVTHNSRETRYWRVKKDMVPGYTEEIENIPHADSTKKEVEELLKRLRVFKEREFADLLHSCHNTIRNLEMKDPVAAFDEIAKILFIKVFVERELLTRRNRGNLFTVDVLRGQIAAADALDNLFQETKKFYSTDKIFAPGERINLRKETGEEIVRKLEKYNLSDTSEDVKGVAFERFLGKTFRGEIGQFFTPRTIVEFMVRMVDPKEGEIVCDPASGSGGFLIRVFELVREKILADADAQYEKLKKKIERTDNTEEEKAKLLQETYSTIQTTIDQKVEDSRLWKLANRCIFGTDANDRMARTSKMNMIMHGDGHGGVHHRDGFLNVNGIFESRFDVILTNPPFGSNVEPTAKVRDEDIQVDQATSDRYGKEYGELYWTSQARIKAAINKPIASLFELPKNYKAKIKTEILFIERCLDLLKPGGRMGIVLPEGIFNNPSLEYVRNFTEDRAFIRAVVSLPAETFVSSGASVKCSLLFLNKFTDDEKKKFDETYALAKAEITQKYAAEIDKEVTRLTDAIQLAFDERRRQNRVELRKELKEYKARTDALKAVESRNLLKGRFDYPIFIYEAEKVGISATGEEDQNELYPNNNEPNLLQGTTLDCFRDFIANFKDQ